MCRTCKHVLMYFCLCMFLWVKFVWKWYKGTVLGRVTPQSEAPLCHYNDHYNGPDFTLGLVVANVCIILNQAFTHIVQDQATWYENLSMFVYQCLSWYFCACLYIYIYIRLILQFSMCRSLFLQGDFLIGLPLVQCQNDTSKVTLYVRACKCAYLWIRLCLCFCLCASACSTNDRGHHMSVSQASDQTVCLPHHMIYFASRSRSSFI